MLALVCDLVWSNAKRQAGGQEGSSLLWGCQPPVQPWKAVPFGTQCLGYSPPNLDLSSGRATR